MNMKEKNWRRQDQKIEKIKLGLEIDQKELELIIFLKVE